MEQGKIPYSVMKRSVWKHTGTPAGHVLRGAGPGNDCGVFETVGPAWMLAQHTFCWEDLWECEGAFYRVLGDVAASGGKAEALEAALTLPLTADEQELRRYMSAIEALAKGEGLEIIGGHTMASAGVNQPIVTLTALGPVAQGFPGKGFLAELHERPRDGKAFRRKAEGCFRAAPGDFLVATKAAGLEGTMLLTRRNRAALSAHYTDAFLMGAEAFEQQLSVLLEAQIAWEMGVGAMHNGGEGGVFGALWEFAEGAGLGFQVDLKAIPVRQETVEICEFLNKNPYQLAAGGMMLIAAAQGEALAERLRQSGIPAVVIGQFTKEKAKCLHNQEEVRYLDRPGQDAVWIE